LAQVVAEDIGPDAVPEAGLGPIQRRGQERPLILRLRRLRPWLQTGREAGGPRKPSFVRYLRGRVCGADLHAGSSMLDPVPDKAYAPLDSCNRPAPGARTATRRVHVAAQCPTA